MLASVILLWYFLDMTTPDLGNERLGAASERISSEPHYSYQVQLLIDSFNEGLLPEVENITVEPRYGYVASINYREGGTRIIYGHDTGFNAGSSEALAKDKGYSKFILRHLGINTPNGEEFLLPWWADALRESERQRSNDNIRDTSQADEYIRSTLQYPIYVKPVSGSQGVGVRKIHDNEELQDSLDEFNQERVKVALVEEALSMPDYRLLVFDGQLVNAYEREPLSVIGDGEATVLDLIHQKNDLYRQQERDIHLDRQLSEISRYLGRIGITLLDIIPEGERTRLIDVSNLSAGGTPRDISHEINERWVDLAYRIAKGFNLRICGVDLACQDISLEDSDYSVIEVNGTPGARHFMSTSEESRTKLRDMFISFFRTPS